MLTNFKESETKTDVWYELVFDDGRGCGFWFPCDEDGNVLPMENPAAHENLAYCRANADRFARSGKVVRQQNSYRARPSGICDCGELVELRNEYQGACQCPKCGRWYNLSGQELLPPDRWEEDEYEKEEEW